MRVIRELLPGRSYIRITILALLTIFLLAQPAMGALIEFRFESDDYGLLDDSYVRDTAGGTNYGSDDNLKNGNSGSNVYRAYERWNITNLTIMGCASVVNATVWHKVDYLTQNPDVEFYNVYSDKDQWTEAGITWNNQPCGTAFNDATNCNLTSMNTTPWMADETWYPSDVTDAWKINFNNGFNNLTLALKDDNEGSTDYGYVDSKEATSSSDRPYTIAWCDDTAAGDTDPPYFSDYNNNTFNNETDLDMNATVYEANLDTCFLEWKETDNYTASNISGTLWQIITVGNYSAGETIWWRWWCNDTWGYANYSINISYVVPAAPVPPPPPGSNCIIMGEVDEDGFFIAYSQINCSITLQNISYVTNYIFNNTFNQTYHDAAGYVHNGTTPGNLDVKGELNATDKARFNEPVMMYTRNITVDNFGRYGSYSQYTITLRNPDIPGWSSPKVTFYSDGTNHYFYPSTGNVNLGGASPGYYWLNMRLAGDAFVYGGDITGKNSEKMELGNTDDMIDFKGASGTTDQTLRFDLDETSGPRISSPTGTTIFIDEDVNTTKWLNATGIRTNKECNATACWSRSNHADQGYLTNGTDAEHPFILSDTLNLTMDTSANIRYGDGTNTLQNLNLDCYSTWGPPCYINLQKNGTTMGTISTSTNGWGITAPGKKSVALSSTQGPFALSSLSGGNFSFGTSGVVKFHTASGGTLNPSRFEFLGPIVLGNKSKSSPFSSYWYPTFWLDSNNPDHDFNIQNRSGDDLLTVEQDGGIVLNWAMSIGTNTQDGLDRGGLNATDVYYDALHPKSPEYVIQDNAKIDGYGYPIFVECKQAGDFVLGIEWRYQPEIWHGIADFFNITYEPTYVYIEKVNHPDCLEKKARLEGGTSEQLSS